MGSYEFEKKEMKCQYNEKTIYGVAYVPKIEKKKVPAVILSHGFNGIGADMEDVAIALASNGVFAYCYDFCGGSTRSKSSQSTVDMSIASQQDDLRAVLDMIWNMEKIAQDQVYLYGESQGGFVTALTAAEEEIAARTAGLFLVYPAFCIPDNWANKKEEVGDEPFDFWGVMLSKKFCEGIPVYDVFEHVKKYDRPVQIFHGDRDEVVNLSYSKRLVETYPNAELTVIEGGGHGFDVAGRERVGMELCQFVVEGRK